MSEIMGIEFDDKNGELVHVFGEGTNYQVSVKITKNLFFYLARCEFLTEHGSVKVSITRNGAFRGLVESHRGLQNALLHDGYKLLRGGWVTKK